MIKYFIAGAVFYLGGTCSATNHLRDVLVVDQTTQALPTLDDIILTDPDLTTLATAFVTAKLNGVLCTQSCNFTAFAPTNEAFEKLPAGTVDTLVKPENKAALTKILTYHVVAGKLSAADLTDGKKLKTVQGEELTVKNAGGKVTLTDAKGGSANVTIADVVQSNGVIHVLDTVVMPKA